MAVKPRPALRLSSKEKKAVREFLAAMCFSYGDKIKRAALFGSKARGEGGKYSDVDLLLITSDERWKYRLPVSVVVSDIALKYGVALDVRVVSEARWRRMENARAGLYQNIVKDAVPIRFPKTISRAQT